MNRWNKTPFSFRARLVLPALVVIVFSGCSGKVPVAELEAARRQVAYATEVGAGTWAPGEYELARQALEAAERQIEQQHYRAAQRTLELARRYAQAAGQQTEQAQSRLAEQERRRVEQERLVEQENRRRELQQQEAQRLLLLEQERRRKAEARQQAAPKPAVPVEKKPGPVPSPTEPERVERYEVRSGQTLAVIAGLPEVYGDSLLWPLIYRANRDQIKAPQEISPGQILDIPRDKNREELETARQEARDLNLF